MREPRVMDLLNALVNRASDGRPAIDRPIDIEAAITQVNAYEKDRAETSTVRPDRRDGRDL